MRYIELTRSMTGEPVLVNTSQILMISKNVEDGTEIAFHGDAQIWVDESYKLVKEALDK